MNDKHFVYIHKMYNIGYITLIGGIATTPRLSLMFCSLCYNFISYSLLGGAQYRALGTICLTLN